MKNSAWSRRLLLGCAAAVLLLTAGDSALTQVVTDDIGIDPLSILNLQIKPNVLILLDTSGSLRQPPPGTNMTADDPISKMYQAKKALNSVLTDNQKTVNFGFARFSMSNADKALSYDDSTNQTYSGAMGTCNGTTCAGNGENLGGPLMYVSMDDPTTSSVQSFTNTKTFFGDRGSKNKDLRTGYLKTGTFTANSGATTQALSLSVWNSLQSVSEAFDAAQSGASCSGGPPCRRFLFSRLLRDKVKMTWNTTVAGTNGTQPTTATQRQNALTKLEEMPDGCPAPPAGMFPDDPTGTVRPCMQFVDASGKTSNWYYTGATWQGYHGWQNTDKCGGSAVLSRITSCTADNVPTIKQFLKPELPVYAVDANGKPIASNGNGCGGDLGMPCGLTPVVNNGTDTTPIASTNPALSAGLDAESVLGIIGAQLTPTGQAMRDILNSFGTATPAFPSGDAKDYIILVTDGLETDTCPGAGASTAALDLYTVNGGSKTHPRVETFVIGFKVSDMSTLDNVAMKGSGDTRKALVAQDTTSLTDALNKVLNSIGTGEFSDQQTITESVFEFGPKAGKDTTTGKLLVDPFNPDTRYSKLIPMLLQSTFEMPEFIGHLNAFVNNGTAAAEQVWDAGDLLCQQVTGYEAVAADPTSTTAANRLSHCDVTTAGSQVNANAMGGTAYVFADMIGTNNGSPFYTQSTGRLRRRIFTTTRNGVFDSTNGVLEPLWPPTDAVDPAYDKNSKTTPYPAGSLDKALGIDSLDFATLQSQFNACRTGTGTTIHTHCTGTTTEPRTSRARKEAREMILAFAAGAVVVPGTGGYPTRSTATTSTGEILYKAKTWILGDATMSGAAVVAQPSETLPTFYQEEYKIFRDGLQLKSTDQMELGLGLRNPDKGVTGAGNTMKPLMTVVYYGANDMLHAFRAGPCATENDNTSCTEKGGEELWGFVPFDQLSKLTLTLREGQSRSNHKYMVATALRFGEVFVPGTYNDAGGTSRAGKWRTYLFFGRGLGGKYYTALDVTNPGVFTQTALSTRPPLAVWSRGNPDTQDGTATGAANAVSPDLGVSDAAAYATMGQTWSVPALTRVNTKDATGNALNGSLDFLLYVGSGYGSSGQGTNLYAINPLNGDVINRVDVGSGTGWTLPGSSPAVTVSNAIIAAPAVFNAEQLTQVSVGHSASTVGTKVYVGDLHGRLWMFPTDIATTTASVPSMTKVRMYDFAAASGGPQPIANAVALLNYKSDGNGFKPHIYVETGNDKRLDVPPSKAFLLAGLRDEGTTTANANNATLLFSYALPDRYRGTVQPATAMFNDGNTTVGRVFFATTRFNPVSETQCKTTFDSRIYAVGAGTGQAAFDLNNNSVADSGDEFFEMTGDRVNAVQVAFGKLVVDQGLDAGTPPPPPAPPRTGVTGSAQQVFVKTVNAAGSTVCR